MTAPIKTYKLSPAEIERRYGKPGAAPKIHDEESIQLEQDYWQHRENTARKMKQGKRKKKDL